MGQSSDVCGTCFSPNSLTIFCKEVKVGCPDIHNFDFARAVVLLVLRECWCFARMPNKYSDAVMMQLRVFQACPKIAKISILM